MSNQASRREFLKRASALSLAGSAAPFALNLAALGEAAAASSDATATGYKAIVCVFLYGGNDYANTVVPYDQPNYDLYKAQRVAIATPREQLVALSPTLGGGRQYGLAPQLAPMLPMFDAGQMAVMLNIGTLIEPTSKTQYLAKSVRLPPKLFSHNDQQSIWQSSLPEGSTSGWGGRMGDVFAAGNGNATFTCVSVAGNAVYLSGNSAVQYQVTPNGSVALTGVTAPLFGSTACSDALRSLVTAPRPHLYEAEHTRVMTRSIDADRLLTGALPDLTTVFPATGLGAQLRMVARMIAARNTLLAKRQVFFVSLGGFDTHDNLLAEHPGLLGEVAGALAAFNVAMNTELNVANQVTTFTASDFGRTLTTDGDGSDHGWGSMHFVMGGAVKGGALYGTPPAVANDGPNDVGQGRLLPGIAVDQFGGTLGTWFGVNERDLQTVMPNLRNFPAAARDMNFMRPG